MTTQTYNYDQDCAKQQKNFIKFAKVVGTLNIAFWAALGIFATMNPAPECFGPAGCGIEPVQETTASLVTVIGDGGHIEYID